MLTYVQCGHCGGCHQGPCPRIKAVEYYENGTIKRVEYVDGGSIEISGQSYLTHPKTTDSGVQPWTPGQGPLVPCIELDDSWFPKPEMD